MRSYSLVRLLPIVLLAVAAVTLAGCTPAATVTPEPKRTPSGKTEAQWIESLTDYKDVASLQLPASASADQFGQWAVGLEEKASFADCTRVRDIVKAGDDLNIYDWNEEFYPKIAAANEATLTVAAWGTNWQQVPAAVTWHDAGVANEITDIAVCMKGDKDTLVGFQYVSAVQSGSSYAVTMNGVPGAKSTEAPTHFVIDYETAIQDGHIIITSMKAG